MSKPEAYKLTIKAIVKSKAKLFKFIPLKSIVAGEIFKISFQFQNISDETFPGVSFNYQIFWPSEQFTTDDFEIPALKKNESYNSPTIETEAFCEGFALIFANKKHELMVKDEQGRMRLVKLYKGKHEDDYLRPQYSIASAKAKRSEEIYEFWAMIISAIGLLIIALEKIVGFFDWLL